MHITLEYKKLNAGFLISLIVAEYFPKNTPYTIVTILR